MSEQPQSDLLFGDFVTLISEPTPRLRRRSHPIRSLVAPVLLLLSLSGLVLAASAVPRDRISLFSRDGSQLGKLARGLLDGLRTDDLAKALAWCAEHPEIAERLATEDRRVYGGETDSPASMDAARQARVETLSSVRTDLEGAGLDWRLAQPVAFVGVRGKIRDAETMRRAVEVALGRIILVQGSRAYAIECSARKVGRAYAVVDIWSWTPLETPAGTVEVEIENQLRSIQQEVQVGSDARVSSLRPFRVEL